MIASKSLILLDMLINTIISACRCSFPRARPATIAEMRLLFFGPRIFGIRTGLSLGREDFRLAGQQRTTAGAGAVFDPDHGFIYVVKGDNGLCKIGITETI